MRLLLLVMLLASGAACTAGGWRTVRETETLDVTLERGGHQRWTITVGLSGEAAASPEGAVDLDITVDGRYPYLLRRDAVLRAELAGASTNGLVERRQERVLGLHLSPSCVDDPDCATAPETGGDARFEDGTCSRCVTTHELSLSRDDAPGRLKLDVTIEASMLVGPDTPAPDLRLDVAPRP